VTQNSGKTLFCSPIGHRQERGDYQESWQPHPMKKADLEAAQNMADEVTRSLTGFGIWGVEFFLTDEGVYFSELSPRPHDTGMVTLAGTQNLNEFELHLRAVLGLPIPKIELLQAGASAVVLAEKDGLHPQFSGIEDALAYPKTEVRVFGKPSTRPYRRMAVALTYDSADTKIQLLRERANNAARKVTVHSSR
jgi:phosphoribosylglycinamide formyltransferase 2